MALYAYVKEHHRAGKELAHFFSYVSLFIGSLLLFWSFYPIVSFEIYSRFFIREAINTPIPRSEVASSVAQANSVLGTSQVFSNNVRDFVKADLWFPTQPKNVAQIHTDVKEYTLSIPKINIKDARVVVGGEDLTNNLVHYLPVGLPGQKGNVAIFGHSSLTQLYDEKNYKTIFTYLPSLEKGDVVDITMNNTKYEYEIYDMFIVKPDQVSVLEQKYDDSYLTLVTCVPPGTAWNRLIIKAKLKDSALSKL